MNVNNGILVPGVRSPGVQQVVSGNHKLSGIQARFVLQRPELSLELFRAFFGTIEEVVVSQFAPVDFRDERSVLGSHGPNLCMFFYLGFGPIRSVGTKARRGRVNVYGVFAP